MNAAVKSAHERGGNAVKRPAAAVVGNDNRLVNRNEHVMSFFLKLIDDFGGVGVRRRLRLFRLFQDTALDNRVRDCSPVTLSSGRIEPNKHFLHGPLLPYVGCAVISKLSVILWRDALTLTQGKRGFIDAICV